MKFCKIIILIFLISALFSCQKNEKKQNDNIGINQINFEQFIPDSNLLTTRFRFEFISRTISGERERRFSQSQDLFFNALQAHKENNIYLALEYIESAINIYPESIYYYHYGVFLMNIEDFENAEKAFNVAIHFAYLETILRERSSLYTFDNNGFPQEIYFAYYNLARIYSINMDLEKSLEYLFYSIERGNPCLNHILSDVDLSNLFFSNVELESIIKNKVQNGFSNILTGRIFENDRLHYYLGYYFIDEKNVKMHIPDSAHIREHVLYGTYEIKNYNVYIYFYRETGLKGVEGTNLPGVSSNIVPYSKYENYSNEINRNEILPLIDIINENDWKPVNRFYFFVLDS
jgi:tetratricopeptide (TPR) repeat protein